MRQLVRELSAAVWVLLSVEIQEDQAIYFHVQLYSHHPRVGLCTRYTSPCIYHGANCLMLLQRLINTVQSLVLHLDRTLVFVITVLLSNTLSVENEGSPRIAKRELVHVISLAGRIPAPVPSACVAALLFQTQQVSRSWRGGYAYVQ